MDAIPGEEEGRLLDELAQLRAVLGDAYVDDVQKEV
jgi:hypothetical protein